MAILVSPLLEFEVRVLWAWEHGSGYAFEARWNGVPILNPQLLAGRDRGTAQVKAPPGWFTFQAGHADRPLHALLADVLTLPPDCGGGLPWRSHRFPDTRFLLHRSALDGSFNNDVFTLTVWTTAAQFAGAVMPAERERPDADRLHCALSIECVRAAAEGFVAELREETDTARESYEASVLALKQKDKGER